MIVTLDAESPLPPFEQLRRQIAAMISLGALSPGARLPSIRQLAADLDVAPGTVARAYRELQREGLVEPHGRHGTTVSRRPPSPQDDAHEKLRVAARSFAAVAAESGHDLDDAIAAVRRAFGALRAPAA